MTDNNSGDNKTLSFAGKKTLSLKPAGTEQSTVRQKFSHGRTHAVVVETKRRKFTKPGEKDDIIVPISAPAATPAPEPVVAVKPVVEQPVVVAPAVVPIVEAAPVPIVVAPVVVTPVETAP
ncbi:MAG: translation initiation factor IF-2 associated domain-containing protein, partial [Notoacmeibacter sp.]